MSQDATLSVPHLRGEPSDDDLHALVSGHPSIYENAPPPPVAQNPAIPAPSAQPSPPQPVPTDQTLALGVQPNGATEAAGVAPAPEPKLREFKVGGVTLKYPEGSAEAQALDRELKYHRSLQSQIHTAQLAQAVAPKPAQQPVAQPPAPQPNTQAQQDEIDALLSQAQQLEAAGEYDKALSLQREALRKTRQQNLEVYAYVHNDVKTLKQEREQERQVAAFQSVLNQEREYIKNDLNGSGIDPDQAWSRLSEWRIKAVQRGYNPTDVFGPDWTNQWYDQIKQELSQPSAPIQPPGPTQPQPVAQQIPPTGVLQGYKPVNVSALPGGSASFRGSILDRGAQEPRSGLPRRTAPEGSLDRLFQ